MKLFGRVSIGETGKKLSELHRELDHRTDAVDRRLEALDQRTASMDRKLGEIGERLEELAGYLLRNAKFGASLGERPHGALDPDREQKLARTFPGKIFNRDRPCTNPAFVELLKRASGDEVADGTWERVLAEALIEASSVPGAVQVFERQASIENYLSELSRKFRARYASGWADLDDALFLYWLVRQTKPRRVVQCGAFNGRSSAFMMLALAKNGPEGTLTIIDQPPIFDPEDPEWMVEGRVYNAVVPAGKTSGWMVPDQYRDRLEIWNGEAQALLPKVLDRLEAVDLFYHASDHTHQHMMAAFGAVKPKLRQGGLIVAVDAAWNASLWDFAERCGVPSYTFKSAVGVGFF